MTRAFIPFSRPSVTNEEIAAVVATLRSGWITTGPKNAELEQAIAAHTGACHCVAVCSATAGMHVALMALGVGPGDEVITPSMTWVSTINLIELLGARPVFVDIDRDTLMTDAERVSAAITPRTKVIVPVHFAGAPLDLDPLYALASSRDIALVEDAAHCAGTRYRGEIVGGRGIAVLSFQAIKNLTCAEGGAVCVRDEALAARIRRLKFHGLGADAFDREMQGRAPKSEVLEPGLKYNLPDMNAAMAVVQLQRLAQNNARRRALAQRYARELAGLPGLLPLGLPRYPFDHAWHLYAVRIDPDTGRMNRDRFMHALKERGIATGIHFHAAHEHRYYRERYPEISLPDTEWNSARICSLPLFPDLSDDDQGYVIDCIRAVLGGET